jgi:hypothetical protein
MANATNTVPANEDYLAFLHDALSENQVRLREILGESQAKAVFNWSADRLVNTLRASKYSSSPVDGVVRKLTCWGMTVSRKERGNLTELEVKCPYAERMHPRMASREPVCPLGEYILGAVRLEDSKSQLIHNSLTKEGVRFTLERLER